MWWHYCSHWHASVESEVSVQKIYTEFRCIISHGNFLRRFQVRAVRGCNSNHQLKMGIYLILVMIVGLV